MNSRFAFAGIGVLALLAGAALWFGSRGHGPRSDPPAADLSPAALHAATFRDEDGREKALGAYAGKVLVLNFWATWCAPCREEMPGFVRLQARWGPRGVQFLGLANDEPEKVRAFGRELRVNYPLWTGEENVTALSRRLGNRLGVLPHTVLVDPQGRILESRIGIYPEGPLESRLQAIARGP